MRLSVLDQSPISEGSTGRRRAAQHASTSRASPTTSATTATGWPSTTARRCSRAPSPRSLIGPIASATSRLRVGSGGVMLPALQPVQGRRELQRPRRALPRPHRPRPRPRAGHRPADDVRPPARPPRSRAGRLPRAARRAARLPRGPAAARTTRSRGSAACPGVPERPSRGCSAPRPERDLGGRARAALLVRRLHQPGRRRDRRAATASASSTPSASEAPRRSSRVGGDLRRDRRGGRAARVQRADGVRAAAPGAAHHRPAGRGGAALPRAPRRAAERAARVVGSPETVRARARGGRRRLRPPRSS